MSGSRIHRDPTMRIIAIHICNMLNGAPLPYLIDPVSEPFVWRGLSAQPREYVSVQNEHGVITHLQGEGYCMGDLLMAALTLTSCFRLTYPSSAAIIHCMVACMQPNLLTYKL